MLIYRTVVNVLAHAWGRGKQISQVWGQLGSFCLCPPSPKCWDDRPVAMSVCLMWVLGIPTKDSCLHKCSYTLHHLLIPSFRGVVLVLETGFTLAQACLEFVDAFLPRPTKCQDWRGELPPSLMLFLNLLIKRESPLKDFLMVWMFVNPFNWKILTYKEVGVNWFGW